MSHFSVPVKTVKYHSGPRYLMLFKIRAAIGRLHFNIILLSSQEVWIWSLDSLRSALRLQFPSTIELYLGGPFRLSGSPYLHRPNCPVDVKYKNRCLCLLGMSDRQMEVDGNTEYIWKQYSSGYPLQSTLHAYGKIGTWLSYLVHEYEDCMPVRDSNHG